MARQEKKSGKKNEFNVKEGLALLKNMPKEADAPAPRRRNSSIRQLVFQGYQDIKQLMAQGYTRRQICVYLRQKLNVDFSDTTFYNYMAEAAKEFGDAGGKNGTPDTQDKENCDSSIPDRKNSNPGTPDKGEPCNSGNPPADNTAGEDDAIKDNRNAAEEIKRRMAAESQSGTPGATPMSAYTKMKKTTERKGE